MSFWGELGRRNVVKVAIAHAIVGWMNAAADPVLKPRFAALRDRIRSD